MNMDYKAEIKKAIEDGKLIIGSRKVIKKLKLGKLKLIVMASNCPEHIKNEIEYYSKLSNVKVDVFDGTGKELGVFCGKPFPIAVIGIE